MIYPLSQVFIETYSIFAKLEKIDRGINMAGRSLEVDVNAAIIKWARESSGWSVDEIAKKLKVSKEEYEKIESGFKLPTFKQLELLANYLKRPVAVFFLQEPPEESPFTSSFRILPKNEQQFSKELRLAVRKSRYYQSILNELMKDLGIDTKSEVGVLTLQDNPQEFAQEERRRMGISPDEQFKWKSAFESFNVWRSAIESRNILIFQFKFLIEDARGFSLMDKEPSAIVINSTDNILARIFTLFHEYAHILLGVTEIYVGEEGIIAERNIEDWCNRFAGEFLVPEEVLKEDKDFLSFAKSGGLTPEILQNLSRKFKVSKQAILTRLRVSNFIEDETYKRESRLLKEGYTPVLKKGRFLASPEKCIQEKGKRFVSIILQGKERGVLTTADTIEYLSIQLKYLDKVQELFVR